MSTNKTQPPFPVCRILGVNIAVTNMSRTLDYLKDHLEKLSGSYICISNVHTTVMSYEDPAYRKIQNSAVLALPDGAPLSAVCRKRGFPEAERVTGPDLMGEIFRISVREGYRHYFYGSTQETLDALEVSLMEKYPGIRIAGMYAPPFRPLSEGEDQGVVEQINRAQADFVWVGLGAPKQELWMAEHRKKIQGLMIGVGAGFDYHAGTLKRAPGWMQRCSLEWVYRLLQDPGRLWKRYWVTNRKFLRLVRRENNICQSRKNSI
ncbi:MAG: WecB/TagA/CpsF family glycosyltransferase [Lachnospiraceae bacterium]|jgi:N-acetylglucosaminyldiphosphoundecaprenol N-acetyl-beta-D-mannosaminyltransferase|nr:WecB/TagA/CpsF family glycosyltransferase [Lachnospiraceae bacterium]MCI8995567.1 WecB/TagA/CpsF family glycosyltransferase [Lachnospiraceae bacterium]MCI9132626.1 WecB/TagA/CpsF family glycosyltransferase [Lachnospiraceae bacterium]